MKIGRSYTTAIAVHNALETGVHGVGADDIISDAEAILQALLTTRGDIAFRGALVAERLAKGTEGHILKQGANDPAWVAPLTFTELAGGQNHAVGASTTWTDYDISAIVPAGALYALIGIHIDDTNAYTVGVRKNGTALERLLGLDGSGGTLSHSQLAITTALDANRVIEIYGNITHTIFNVLGYWS